MSHISAKLTKQQREELKQVVLDGIVHSFTINEIQQFVQGKLNIQLSIDYLKHLKLSLKDDLIKDRMAYIHALFFERLAELKSYPRLAEFYVILTSQKLASRS
jgi:hypothetical protein